MITFRIDEILEIAEQIERNGAKFYRNAAEHAQGAETSDLLLTLGVMEGMHEKTFAALRKELPQSADDNATYDPDDQGALYLQAMADSKVFSANPWQALTGDEPAREVLAFALDREKDSIVFFQSMTSIVTDDEGRKKLRRIINEEIGHVVILTKQLEATQ